MAAVLQFNTSLLGFQRAAVQLLCSCSTHTTLSLATSLTARRVSIIGSGVWVSLPWHHPWSHRSTLPCSWATYASLSWTGSDLHCVSVSLCLKPKSLVSDCWCSEPTRCHAAGGSLPTLKDSPHIPEKKENVWTESISYIFCRNWELVIFQNDGWCLVHFSEREDKYAQMHFLKIIKQLKVQVKKWLPCLFASVRRPKRTKRTTPTK